MLVTNPANRATLAEVMAHPWMVRGFSGPPAIHMVHREPLRADELDRQVIKGMQGFEFGTEDEIERKLVNVLESDAYIRAVQYWERKRSKNNLNGNGSRWGESVSNSSLAMSFDSASGKTDSSYTPKKSSRRFSGFDYYRRKLFSPASSPPGSPLSHSPPHLHHHLAHPSFSDHNREPLDPTKGFHPLISMYYLAREKLERDRVYGPGQFASSQLSITGEAPSPTAINAHTPADDTSMRQQQRKAAASQPQQPATVAKKDPTPSANIKADYSMPLPRLPAPETSHYSGMSYDNTVSPSPTSPTFAQPRARDLGLPPPSPSAQPRQHIEIDESALGAKKGLPRAPPPSTHRRSHSMSQRPTALARGWVGMFGGGGSGGAGDNGVDEEGVNSIPPAPKTAGPEITTFSTEKGEHMDGAERSPPTPHDHTSPFSSGATLVRKFGSLLVGGRADEKRHGTVSSKRGTILGVLGSSRPSVDSKPGLNGAGTTTTDEKYALDGKDDESSTPATTTTLPTPSESITPTSSPTATKGLSPNLSQPVGNVHRRAATILDPQGRSIRHERRSSTGAAIMGSVTGGTIGRHRRPSTGYSTNRPLAERLFSRNDQHSSPAQGEGVVEKREEEEGDGEGDIGDEGLEETFREEDERHTSEKDFKPVFLKGLFRCVTFGFSSSMLMLMNFFISLLQRCNHFHETACRY